MARARDSTLPAQVKAVILILSGKDAARLRALCPIDPVAPNIARFTITSIYNFSILVSQFLNILSRVLLEIQKKEILLFFEVKGYFRAYNTSVSIILFSPSWLKT
jgi:hypothetical protein